MPQSPLDLALSAREDGGSTVLAVRAQPGARRSSWIGLHGARLKVALAAPPLDGRANAELAAFLARSLGLRASEVRLLRGARSRDKDVSVPLPLETVRQRLLPLLPAGG